LSPGDVGELLDPENRSYHPVRAPSIEGSPSVLPALAGAQINCTDCHGNSDPTGPRGPHGSAFRFILAADYMTTDGTPESPSTFALCYRCHDRERVLDSAAFPEHRMHVVQEKASCATCHNPHGSIVNRGLIRFGEETVVAGVAPSGMTGRLAFVSKAWGAGTCYVTCHGYDHAGTPYGNAPARLKSGAAGSRKSPPGRK
jgi:predicted CXXCH cytochrome family protein